MQQTQLTHEQKLVKFNISHERYNTQFNALRTANFSVTQANQLILRRGSNNSVIAVLNNYQLLDNQFPFSKEDIMNIAAHAGGFKNIESVKKSFSTLLALKLSPAQIVRISGNCGGHNNIDAINKGYKALAALKLSAEQIVKIAMHDGGAKNIEAIKRNFSTLTALKFSPLQIVKIAGMRGGSKNIEAVKSAFIQLTFCNDNAFCSDCDRPLKTCILIF